MKTETSLNHITQPASKPLLASVLPNFLMWLHYNQNKISIDIDIYAVAKEFISATSKHGKYCKCKSKDKAVNGIWVEWHCTYCMKPKLSKNGN